MKLWFYLGVGLFLLPNKFLRTHENNAFGKWPTDQDLYKEQWDVLVIYLK